MSSLGPEAAYGGILTLGFHRSSTVGTLPNGGKLPSREHGMDFADTAVAVEVEAKNESGRDATARAGDLD